MGMISEEIILERDRVECLANELSDMLRNDKYFQFKIRITRDQIVVIPHVKPIEIALS